MVRPLPLLLALILLGGCLSVRTTADSSAIRYRSVDAAMAAHPDVQTRGLTIVDGVIVVGGAMDTIPAREVASVEVVRTPRCGDRPVEPQGCPVLVVTTRSALRMAEQARRRMGSLRIRVRDEATGRFIAAEYYAVADDSSAEEPIASGASGWGRQQTLRPGRYRMQLFEYPCGDSLYLADEAWAVREAPPVLISPRRRTDVDLRIDVRAVPADTAFHPARCEPGARK